MQAISRSGSKKELVGKELREAILRGELLPGTRLLIEDLAGLLNVSPIPVREALQQLQAEGFVVIEPYVGATVAPIELESIDEVFRLLETMEMVSSVAACRHMSDEGFVELHSLLVHMDSLVDDPEAWSAANKQFHQLICDRSGTRLVGSLMPRVLDHLDRFQRYFLKDVFAGLLPKAQREHWAILRTLQKRDLARIETLVQQHNRACLQAFTKHLRETESRRAGASAGESCAESGQAGTFKARGVRNRLVLK